MNVLRNQRTYPLTLKSAVQYALNAGITAAYDFQGDPNNAYAGGDGVPHVGTKSYTKPVPGAALVQVTSDIGGRDPSNGRTSTATYVGPSMVDFGIGSSDGKGAFSIHRRFRTPSTVLSNATRSAHVIRAASGSTLVLYMTANTGGYFYFRWECAGTIIPAGDAPAIRVNPNTLCDIHLTRNGDTVTVYLNGAQVGSASVPSLVTYNTAWGGLASGTADGLSGSPADDLVLIDETYWNRALTAGEVKQHQSDPYAGYANTAIVPDGVTITNPFAGAIVNNEGFTIAGYYSGATAPTGIEYRFNGSEWTPLAGAQIGGGAFSGQAGATASATGALDVRFVNAPGITSSVANITAKVPDPTVTLVSQPPPDGQSQAFTFTTTRADSVAVTLNAKANGAVTQGPVTFNVANNAASGSIDAIPPGDYTVAITATGPGGSASIVGNAISILGVAGGGEAVFDAPINAPVVTGVVVSPSQATVAGGASQQFSWVVTGANSPSQAVALTASAGTILGNGLFTAPAAQDVPQNITITATSLLDPTKSGSALVTVPAVIIPPDTGTTIQLAGGAVTIQRNLSSGGAVRLAAKFTSDPAPPGRTLYL